MTIDNYSFCYMWFLALQQLILDAMLDFLVFPFWWYGAGMKLVFFKLMDLIEKANNYLVPMMWFQNIYTPIYNYRSWGTAGGFVIWYFVQFLARLILLVTWVVFCLSLLLTWVAVPVFLTLLFFGRIFS